MARVRDRAKGAPPPLPLVLTYLEESRDFATGFLFILPLVFGYEIGLWLLRSQSISWASGVVQLVLSFTGRYEPFAFAALVAGLLCEALRRAERLRIDAELYGLMIAESVVYAAALGMVGSFAFQRFLAASGGAGARSLAHDVVLSVGAGVYEEALFRALLLGAVHYALKTWARMRPGLAAFLAIVVSSAAFAACHHIGPYGDPLEATRLAFRFGMGVAFAGIYVYRGLGIVVYTHALYDVFVSLNR